MQELFYFLFFDAFLFFRQYTVAERHLSLGSALTIALPETLTEPGTKFQLKVDYSTTDKCTAVQYLEAE